MIIIRKNKHFDISVDGSNEWPKELEHQEEERVQTLSLLSFDILLLSLLIIKIADIE